MPPTGSTTLCAPRATAMANKPNQADIDAIVARVAARLGLDAPPRRKPVRRRGVPVMLTMARDDLGTIDEAAKVAGESRSAYMRKAALQRAKGEK